MSAPHDRLPAATVFNVLSRALTLYSEAPSALVRVRVPDHGPDSQAVIVGDLHGQIADLLVILERHGPPGKSNSYIFLGDICDRGSSSVEIWTLLLAFKLRCPGSVVIIRGNHENRSMYERSVQQGGGFADVCRERYSELTALTKLFGELFMRLPLFVLLEDQVFMVHAGLPRVEMSLADLEAIDFQRHYPAPRSKKQIEAGIALDWTTSDAALFDCQWADPHDELGLKPSIRGRDSKNFGRDITRKFCEQNGLRLVVRAHQVPEDLRGFQWRHGGRLLTIFSASKYGGVLKNQGGTAKFRHKAGNGGLDLELFEHDAPEVHDLSTQLATAECANASALARVQESFRPSSASAGGWASWAALTDKEYNAMSKYIEGVLCANRASLWSDCQRMEVASGKVRVVDLTKEVMHLSLIHEDSIDSWKIVLARLAGTGDDGLLDYPPLLERFQVRWFSSTAKVQSVLAAILHAKLNLPETIALFDPNGSGTVDLQECRCLFEKLLPSLSRRQRDHVLGTLQQFWGGAGEVSVARFLAALCADFAPPPKTSTPEWLPGTLEALVAHLVATGPDCNSDAT